MTADQWTHHDPAVRDLIRRAQVGLALDLVEERDRLAAVTARAEAAEAKIARVTALPSYGANLFNTDVESVVRGHDLRAALADEGDTDE